MKSIITLALAVLLLGTCSARIGGAGSSDGSNMESITVLRDFDEAGIGGKAAKAKLSKIKEQLDDSLELKTLREQGTMFVDLSAKLQTRVVDAFAVHDSVLEAAHKKCKDKHPELHAKYMKAKKLVELADRHLAMLQTAARKTKKNQQHLLSKRSNQRLGTKRGFFDDAVKGINTHVLQPATRAMVSAANGVADWTETAANDVYDHAADAVDGIGDHLDDIADAANDAANLMGDGLVSVGGVLVKGVAAVSRAYQHASDHVSLAVAAAGSAASNWAKAGYQWAENAANDIKDFAEAVANAVADFASFIWDMLTGWDCSLSGDDLLTAAQDMFSLNPAGFQALKGAADKAKTFEEGARVVAQGVCTAVWTALELHNPMFSFIYNLLTTFGKKCGMLKNLNPAISLGITLDASVGSSGHAVGAGAEFGVAIDRNGNRMCYIGYCVSSGIAVSLPPASPAGADVGVVMSFWGSAGYIPGTLKTIEFSFSAELATFGIEFDLIYMYSGSIGDFLGIGISGTVGPGGGPLSAGVSLMMGDCNTPICLTTCGDDCDQGTVPTCSNAAAANAQDVISVAESTKTVVAASLPSVGQGGSGTSDGTGILLIRSVDGKCLDASQRSTNGGKVQMGKCDMHNENQQWAYNSATSQIKSRKGICLSAQRENGGKIDMGWCNTNSANQQFEFDAGINRISIGAVTGATGASSVEYKGYCSSNPYPPKYKYATVGATQYGSYKTRNTIQCDAGYHVSCHNTRGCFCTLAKADCRTWSHNAIYTTYESVPGHAGSGVCVDSSERKIDGGIVDARSCDANNHDQMWTMLRCEVPEPVPYYNGWTSFDSVTYKGAESFVSEGICTVSGMIRQPGNNWGHVATLPANCRPNKHLVFNLNNEQYTSRVDVGTNGQVKWVRGGKNHHWLSLTGITFAPGSPIQVALTYYNGYSNGAYGGATATVSGGICMVSGLIKGSRGGHVATLPANCRPNKRLIFNLKTDDVNWTAGQTTRVDVFKNGQVHWVAGGRKSWISLTGITFAPGSPAHELVTYRHGSHAHSGEYGETTATVSGGICMVSGLLDIVHWTLPLVTLPENCRPNRRLVFNLNNNAHTSRVDVLPSGQVHYVGGARSHGWLSLTGITFAPEGSYRCT